MTNVTVTESLVESNTSDHRGELMKLMDETAAISASRVAGNPCLTARISEVEFHTPF